MNDPLSGPPRFFFLCAGTGRGETELLAFDRALAGAGLSEYNLLRVSSIVPPGAEEARAVDLAPGSLLPIAYGSITSETEDLVISAAVAVGLPDSPEAVGVIMEFTGAVSEKEARERAQFMARKALETRGIRVGRVLVGSASARVEGPTAAFAGVALFR